MLACVTTVTPVPPEEPEGVLPKSRALEIVRSTDQIGSIDLEISCTRRATLLLAPSGSPVPDLGVSPRYPSWVVSAHGSFRAQRAAEVTDLADDAWVFVDAGSGEPYGVRFRGNPPCFFGMFHTRCGYFERLRPPCE